MSGRPPKILVIDDEEITLMLLAELLRKESYSVVTTLDPLQGLSLAKAEQPDLIFLDINMPVRNGFSVLSQLRANDILRDVPVIILTSDDHIKSVELAYELGVASYLTKPVNADLLKMKTAEFLGAKS